MSTNSPASVCEEITTALKTNETRHVGCRLGSVGRIVRIRMSGTKPRTLTLCEVEVYGGMHMCQTSTHRYSLILLSSIMQDLTFNTCFC